MTEEFVSHAHRIASSQALAAGVELTCVLMSPDSARDWGKPLAAELPIVEVRSMTRGSITFRADAK